MNTENHTQRARVAISLRSKFQSVSSPFSNILPSNLTTGGATHVTVFKPDKKVIDSVNKRIEKLVQLCQNPRLNLRNSPPYLLDILPDIYDKLRVIVSAYSGALEELFEAPYFQVFLSNLIAKCKMTSQLFKEAKDLMFDERSDYRRYLTKYSLVFSHILKDLEALYPSNKFAPELFRITKREAANWWKQNFAESPIVPWKMFEKSLKETFTIPDKNHIRSLQRTIDLTCNDYVSVFEFDVFVRLFQPWDNVIETWKALAILHAGYMAFMTYDEVKAVLRKFRNHPGPGSYVYRLSCTKLGQWAIGYITEDLKILQTIIQNKSLAQALIDGERDGFYLYPHGTPSQSCILMSLVENLSQTHFQVSLEQCQLYCKMGSTFELCKICTENNKNVRLEPCGHLLCKKCLVNCQSSGIGQTCPFCRLEIKAIEEIILDPYIPAHSEESLSDDPNNKSPSKNDLYVSNSLDLTSSSENKDSKHSNLFNSEIILQQDEDSISTNSVSKVSISKTMAPNYTATPPTDTNQVQLVIPSSIDNSLPNEATIFVNQCISIRNASSLSCSPNIAKSELPSNVPLSISFSDSNLHQHHQSTHQTKDVCLNPLYTGLLDANDNFEDLPLAPPVPTIIPSYDTTQLIRQTYTPFEHPHMSNDVADQLLQITEGNVEMAARIWKQFTPRV